MDEDSDDNNGEYSNFHASSANNGNLRQRSASIVCRFRLLFDDEYSNRSNSGSSDESQNGGLNGHLKFRRNTVPMIPAGPKNFEALKNEEMLRGVIAAFPNLQFSSLKIHVCSPNMPSPSDFWSLLMENFERAVDMGLEYVRLLPGIGLIKPQDRRRIFSQCLLPMAAVQQILMSSELAHPIGNGSSTNGTPGDLFFLNMTPQARALFVSYFPVYQALVKETYEIGVAISRWAPSTVEVAFLEALLFYHCVPGLENANAVGHLRECLLKTIEVHLQSTCSEEKAASVMDQLLSVYKLLMKLPDVHDAVLTQMASQNPEIVGTSQLLKEIYTNDVNPPSKKAAADPLKITSTTDNVENNGCKSRNGHNSISS